MTTKLQRIGVPRLPATLGEAIHALTQDGVVLGALGSYVADQMLAVKRAEWEEYRTHVGPGSTLAMATRSLMEMQMRPT